MLLDGAFELDFSQPWHRIGPVFGDQGVGKVLLDGG
jgi:hypothetical protein